MLDDFVLVSEDALRAATRLIIEKTRNRVEPAGAAALAAVLGAPGRFAGRKVVIVCSDGNIGPAQLAGLRPPEPHDTQPRARARAAVSARLPAPAMSYELQAAVAGAPLIAEMAGRFRQAVAVPLNRGLALIPASGPWLAEVTRPREGRPYPAFDLLSWSLAGFLREWSVRGPVAYVEIEETLDLTFQAAVGWSGGELALAPRVLRPGEARPPGGGPVVEAFRLLGVAGEPGQDDWASFGLYQFSHMEQWLEVPRLIQRLPEMELVWSQPDEAWVGFDFRTDYQTRVGGHPFRLRAGAGPEGTRYTVSFWQRAVLELDQLPVGWRLEKRRPPPPD